MTIIDEATKLELVREIAQTLAKKTKSFLCIRLSCLHRRATTCIGRSPVREIL